MAAYSVAGLFLGVAMCPLFKNKRLVNLFRSIMALASGFGGGIALDKNLNNSVVNI